MMPNTTHCYTLQHCKTLQHAATHWQHTGNTLATHDNTLHLSKEDRRLGNAGDDAKHTGNGHENNLHLEDNEEQPRI